MEIIKCKNSEIIKVLDGFKHGITDLETRKGHSNLLFTGAKAYPLGGGWWRISGYSYDGSDVEKILTKLKNKENLK